MSDKALRASLIRLAHSHPEFRKDLLPILASEKTAEAASNGGFPPDTIGEAKPGGSADGVNGKGTVSDASKPWMANEFTQQEFSELDKKQEAGVLADGKADESPMKVAAQDKALRAGLIRLAHAHPEFRKDLLPLITAGCEKLPEGGMRDNCEKKKEEGAKSDKKDE